MVLFQPFDKFIILYRFSFVRSPTQIETLQADIFVNTKNPLRNFNFRLWRTSLTIGDLKKVVARYLGVERTNTAFSTYPGIFGDDEQPATIEIIRFAEFQLASAIGAASSRRILSMLLSKGNVTRSDALQLLDEASAALQQNRELLQHALDHARQGVTVFDANKNLLCWNHAFQTLFDLPDHMIHVGTPLESIIKYNSARGFYGPGRSDLFSDVDLKVLFAILIRYAFEPTQRIIGLRYVLNICRTAALSQHIPILQRPLKRKRIFRQPICSLKAA